MKLNTVIKLPDGRVGTIVYHNLDGTGGVWGEHWYRMPAGGGVFSSDPDPTNDLPAPQFMLRDPKLKDRLDFPDDCEFVGEERDILFTIIKPGDNGRGLLATPA